MTQENRRAEDDARVAGKANSPPASQELSSSKLANRRQVLRAGVGAAGVLAYTTPQVAVATASAAVSPCPINLPFDLGTDPIQWNIGNTAFGASMDASTPSAITGSYTATDPSISGHTGNFTGNFDEGTNSGTVTLTLDQSGETPIVFTMNAAVSGNQVSVSGNINSLPFSFDFDGETKTISNDSVDPGIDSLLSPFNLGIYQPYVAAMPGIVGVPIELGLPELLAACPAGNGERWNIFELFFWLILLMLYVAWCALGDVWCCLLAILAFIIILLCLIG